MMLAKKHGAFIITFIILLSSFSLIFSTSNVKAIDDDIKTAIDTLRLMGLDQIDFDDVLVQNPYRFTSVWQANDTYEIEGDVDFGLYFSTFLLNSINFLKFQDNIKVSIHKHNFSKSDSAELIKEKEIQINAEFLGEKIQKTNVKLEDLNFTVKKDEYLIFGIQINQSEKPISSSAENKFRTRFIPLVRRVSSYLNNSDDEELQNYSSIINLALEIIEYIDINGEEIGSFINTFRSCSFYYGSKNYNSNVKFSTNNSNFTLYFKDDPDLYFNLQNQGLEFEIIPIEGYFKIANQTKTNITDDNYWPALNIDLLSDIISNVSEYDTDLINWVVLWALYTIEFPDQELANTVRLYLKENNIMTEGVADGDAIKEKLSKKNPVKFSSPSFERNKVIKNLSAELYIHYPKLLSLGLTKVTAAVYDEPNSDTPLATDTKTIDSATLLELVSRGADVPTIFTFDDFNKDYEIEYDHNLSLEVLISNAFTLRPIKILYNSDYYNSHLKYVYEETDNIKIEDIRDKDTYAGGSAVYEINITSKKDDDIDINIINEEKNGSWNVEWVPKSLSIKAGNTKKVTVFINSTAEDSQAYDNSDKIIFKCEASGKTGIDSKKATVRVTKSAVDFNFEVDYPDKIKIKHGETKTYEIKIKNKNKGFIEDSYSVNIKSENGFYDYYISNDILDNVPINEEISLEITIKIPWYTKYESDKTKIAIYSLESKKYADELVKEYTIKTSIIQPNIFENIYHIFENLSEKIGLDDSLGNTGTWILISVFFLLIILIVTIIIAFIKRKFVEIICLERIKEITPDDKAEFKITIKNVSKDVQTYKIHTEFDDDLKHRWNINLSQDQIIIPSKQKETIKLFVKPTDYVQKEDWAEVKIIVKPVDKNKSKEIETITVIKDSNKKITISGVIHWPKRFKGGDRVETSFKIYNNGDISAENLSILLIVNGVEKNKIENVTIPRGGYADIEIPWIAEKGKNEIEIIVI